MSPEYATIPFNPPIEALLPFTGSLPVADRFRSDPLQFAREDIREMLTEVMG